MHKVIVSVIQHRDWTIETVMQSYLQSFVGKRCWWQHLLLCHTLPTYEIYWLPDIPKKQWPEASREPWPIFYTISEKLTPIQSHTARGKGRGTTLMVTLDGWSG